MYMCLFVLVLALSANAIPATPQHVNLQSGGAGSVFTAYHSLQLRQNEPMTHAEVKAEMASKLKRQAPEDTLSFGEWDFSSECSRCKGDEIQDEKDKKKCRKCRLGTIPHPVLKKCIKPDTGCADDEIQNADKKCEKCKNNKVPDDAGKTCVPDKDPKCPLGQKPNKTGDKCECPLGERPGPGDKCTPCPNGKCELECPLGQKPNQAGDKCECPVGEKPGPGDKCTPCPNGKCELECPLGQKPNQAGDKCECPVGEKPGPGNKCEPCPNRKCDNNNQDDKQRRREEKEKKWNEQRPKRIQQFKKLLEETKEQEKKKRREEKEKKWKEQKPKRIEKFKKLLEEIKEKEKIEKENEKRNRVRRIGRCLPLVAVAGGFAVADEFGNEFFDEDFLDSMALLELWPPELPIEPWVSEESDKIFEDEKYIEKWVDVGNGKMPGDGPTPGVDYDYSIGIKTEPRRRELSIVENQPYDGGRDLLPPEPELTKRFFQLIPIAVSVVRTVAQTASIAARAGAAVGRALGALSRATIRIARKGTSKKSPKQQLDGAKKLRESKNWLNCLKKKDPVPK